MDQALAGPPFGAQLAFYPLAFGAQRKGRGAHYLQRALPSPASSSPLISLFLLSPSCCFPHFSRPLPRLPAPLPRVPGQQAKCGWREV